MSGNRQNRQKRHQATGPGRNIMCRGALSGVEVTSPLVAKEASVKSEKQLRQTRVPSQIQNRFTLPQQPSFALLSLVSLAQFKPAHSYRTVLPIPLDRVVPGESIAEN